MCFGSSPSCEGIAAPLLVFSHPDPHFMSRVYVDDRSFASSCARGLPPVACLKTMQLSPARRPTLRRTLPEVVANDVELLGSYSMIFRDSS